MELALVVEVHRSMHTSAMLKTLNIKRWCMQDMNDIYDLDIKLFE